MPFAGAANIQDGVTIDLGGLKLVNTTGSITSVGGGASWEDVYPKLDLLRLGVAGGRNSGVGVGGLITGGGNGYFGPLYGFVCDGVINFEVVLGSGRITYANAHENTDLYRALKGGSNNFGIVTRFDLRTFPLGEIWGGIISYNLSTVSQNFQALQDFNTASGDGVDPYASTFNINVWTPAGHTFLVSSLFYAKPEAYPSSLRVVTDIQPQVLNTVRISNFTDIQSELDATVSMGGR